MFHPGGPPRTSSSAESLFKRGQEALYREDDETAFESFLEVLDLNPSNLHCHYLAALCANLLSREDVLEDVCRHALELAPRHPYTIGCEAARYLWLSNFSRAESCFETALQSIPHSADLALGLGILYEYSGETEKGVAAFGRVLELDPTNARAHSSLGGFLAQSGDFEEAMAEYREAKALAPDLENPHQKLGRDYFYEGMLEPAAGEFGHALSEEPEDPVSWFYYLDCLRRMGKCDEAIEVYEEIKQRFAAEPELVSGLYEQFNMKAEALDALERLAAANPDSPDVLARLARVHRESGRLDEAVKLVERMARLVPDDPEALALLGELYLERGDTKEAAALSRRAIGLNPNAQNAYIHLADALLFLGRQQESAQTIADLEQARRRAWELYQAKFSGHDRPANTQN